MTARVWDQGYGKVTIYCLHALAMGTGSVGRSVQGVDLSFALAPALALHYHLPMIQTPSPKHRSLSTPEPCLCSSWLASMETSGSQGWDTTEP